MAPEGTVTCGYCKAVWPMGGAARHTPDCPSLFENVTQKPDPTDHFRRIVHGTKAVKSDGGSSAYYKLPASATDLMDLIEAEEMSFARGNMFKALFRLGKKAGTDVEYDLNKLQWFLDRMREMHSKGQRL